MLNKKATENSVWQTCGENLVRYNPSGTYFMRARVAGKLHVRSLKTNVLSVAKQRLGDKVAKLRTQATSLSAVALGKMKFKDAAATYRLRLKAKTGIKESTKLYYGQAIDALLKSWPTLAETDVKRISERDCQEWATGFFKCYSGNRANNTLAVLRGILDIAVASGACYGNPARSVKRMKIRKKQLTLPSRQQFQEFVKAIEAGHGWCSRDCADYVRFLAFSGCRKGEAAHLVWHDVDFKSGEITVRGDPLHGTKNGEIRRVPMIAELRLLLHRMRSERADEPSMARVLKVRECQKSMDRAARKTGMARITHHDLRHLFATVAIESGIDIPTIARLLGHKDGGVLAMQTYGHLRSEHAHAAVTKVNFGLLSTDEEPTSDASSDMAGAGSS